MQGIEIVRSARDESGADSDRGMTISQKDEGMPTGPIGARLGRGARVGRV